MRFLSFLERFLTMVFWILIIFGFDLPYIAFLTLFAALIHEAGHLFAILLLSERGVSMPKSALSGFRIKNENSSYSKEIIKAGSGPLINIIFFLIFNTGLGFPPDISEYLKSFALINLLTAISNLLPVEGYDGYRILYAWISVIFSRPERALLALWYLSFFIIVIFSFISLYFMLKIGEGYWIFGVCICFLISVISKKTKSTF